jgi:2-amino-4-hydroxy-6-hydroxymethyldihydropteridine diphosphokinase
VSAEAGELADDPISAPVAAVIALGSNLGDREQTLRSAFGALAAVDGVSVVAASGIVETPALRLDGVDHTAPAYLNAIVTVETTLAPLALLEALNRIEDEHDRVRDIRWGDRTLDLDLVSVAGVTLASERLTLPHPRAHERGFVLVPWLDADPDATLPGHGRIAELPAARAGDVSPYAAAPLIGREVGAP